MEVDQYIAVQKKMLACVKLPIGQGQPIWMRVTLDEQTQQFTFLYSLDGTMYTNLGIQLSAEFLYPENHTRFLCFTAPRVGIYAKGVYGEAEGKALVEYFSYQDE